MGRQVSKSGIPIAPPKTSGTNRVPKSKTTSPRTIRSNRTRTIRKRNKSLSVSTRTPIRAKRLDKIINRLHEEQQKQKADKPEQDVPRQSQGSKTRTSPSSRNSGRTKSRKSSSHRTPTTSRHNSSRTISSAMPIGSRSSPRTPAISVSRTSNNSSKNKTKSKSLSRGTNRKGIRTN